MWSIIGAISQVCDLPVTTAVTCPTMRTHPAIIAQAAATSAVPPGTDRFCLGLGSGEALNDTARAFYAHFDFEPSPTDPLHLLLLIKDARSVVGR